MNDLKTFWEGNHPMKSKANEIEELVPSMGKSEKLAVELFRIACNVYHDKFNNGGGNMFETVYETETYNCDCCGGSGEVEVTCSVCDGSGEVETDDCDCCGGSGEEQGTCDDCYGSGEVEEEYENGIEISWEQRFEMLEMFFPVETKAIIATFELGDFSSQDFCYENLVEKAILFFENFKDLEIDLSKYLNGDYQDFSEVLNVWNPIYYQK